MQFRCHSLPVHQSMSVSLALPCPMSSAKSAHAISFDYWPLECVTLEWHIWPGRRSKYNSFKCSKWLNNSTWHIEETLTYVFVSYPRHSFARGLTPMQRSSQRVLQPQPTGLGIKRKKENNKKQTTPPKKNLTIINTSCPLRKVLGDVHNHKTEMRTKRLINRKYSVVHILKPGHWPNE